MIGDQERLLSTSGMASGVWVSRWRAKGTRSIYSIPGALTSQHKYTGQENRVAGTKRWEPEQL
jgi:hypothetical protein